MANLPGTRIVKDGDTTRLETSEWRGLTLKNMTWIELILSLFAMLRDHTYGVFFQGDLSGDLIINKDGQIGVELSNRKYNIRISFEEDPKSKSPEGKPAQRLKVEEIDKKTGKSKGVNIQLQDNVIAYILRELDKKSLAEETIALIDRQKAEFTNLEHYLREQQNFLISYIDKFCQSKGPEGEYTLDEESYKFIEEKASAISDAFYKGMLKINGITEQHAKKITTTLKEGIVSAVKDGVSFKTSKIIHEEFVLALAQSTNFALNYPEEKASHLRARPQDTHKIIKESVGHLKEALVNSASPELVKAYNADNSLQAHFKKAADEKKQQQSGQKDSKAASA